MIYQNTSPSLLKKEEWLNGAPVCSNTILCENIYRADFTLSQLHFHEFVEISVVVSGSGIHRVLNETMECKTGDVYIINAGVPHEYCAKSETEQPTVRNLLFDPTDLFEPEIASPDNPRYCYGVFSKNALTAYMLLSKQQLCEIEHILCQIEEEIMKKQPEWLEAVRAYLTNLLIIFSRCADEEHASRAKSVRFKERLMISETMRAVIENYSDRDMTLEGIAESLFVSKSYLSRIFKKATGEHFSDYVRSIRLKQACRLLKETQLTNEQIAISCGMKDLPTFYSLFKSQFSVTPNQYRKNMKI